MSRSLYQGVAGRVREVVGSADEFNRGTVKGVYYTEDVEYSSGPIGSRTSHTGSLRVVQKWKDEDVRDVRITGVCPSVFLKVSVQGMRKSVFVDMEYSDLVKFGSVSCDGVGLFTVRMEEVSVKVTDDYVAFEEYGWFERADVSLRDVQSATDSSSGQGYTSQFDYSAKCREEVQTKLQEMWAKEVGLYSSFWRIINISKGQKITYITVTPENDALDLEVSFSFLSSSITLDPEDVGDEVFISVAEINEEAIIEKSGMWNLYDRSKLSLLSKIKRSLVG